jgi:hypothetical protein
VYDRFAEPLEVSRADMGHGSVARSGFVGQFGALVCWEAFPSTPYILNATEAVRDSANRNITWMHEMVPGQTPNALVEALPPDPSARWPLAAKADKWEFIKDLESRHRGEMRELRGEWVEEPTTSCPTKEANPEMFHAQYALSQKEARGLVSWRDTGRVQCSQGRADEVMVSALFKSKGVGPGRREATVYGLADLFKQFWVLGCRETLAGTRAGERTRANGRLCLLR